MNIDMVESLQDYAERKGIGVVVGKNDERNVYTLEDNDGMIVFESSVAESIAAHIDMMYITEQF